MMMRKSRIRRWISATGASHNQDPWKASNVGAKATGSPCTTLGKGQDILSQQPNSELQPDSQLCSRCRQVNFEELFSREKVWSNGDFVPGFNPAGNNYMDPDCSFCQALKFIDPAWTGSLPKLYDTQNGKKAQKIPHGNICITFSAYTFNADSFSDRAWGWEGYLAERQVIEGDIESFPAYSIKPSVDFAMIQEWLGRCSSEHRCLRRNRETVPSMRLIHCRTRRVVPVPDDEVNYAALSYIWGPPGDHTEADIESMNNHGRLPDDLPPTIADAISVTESLGLEYLWIDRYCIRQETRSKEEEQEKHGQISNMHHIYGGAYVTIIAAAGNGPSYGLPGIGSRKRHYPRVQVGSRILFPTLPNPEALILRSEWSSRAWAYQEGLLSRRCLIFTDQQTLLRCNWGLYLESLGMAEIGSSLQLGFWGFKVPLSDYFDPNPGGLDFWGTINHYSCLNLTYAQDILNGILGILESQQDDGLCDGKSVLQTYEFRHVAGVPIVLEEDSTKTWEVALSYNLVWRCGSTGVRREGFPSWSWTGWTSRGFTDFDADSDIPKFDSGIRYRELTGLGDTEPEADTKFLGVSTDCNTLGNHRRPSLSVEGPDSTWIAGNELEKLLSDRHDFSHTRTLLIKAMATEATIFSVKPTEWNSHSCIDHFHDNTKRKISGLDNTGGTIAVTYAGDNYWHRLNLSASYLKDIAPAEGLKFYGIVFYVNPRTTEASDPSDHPGAIVLVVKEVDDGFERLGVSYIRRETLAVARLVRREFKLV